MKGSSGAESAVSLDLSRESLGPLLRMNEFAPIVRDYMSRICERNLVDEGCNSDGGNERRKNLVDVAKEVEVDSRAALEFY